MNDLHDLLDRVTDRVESPDLAARALAGARRRRTRHRGVLAAGIAAAVVVSVAVVGEVSQHDADSTPPVTPSTSSPTGTAPTQTSLADISQTPWAPRAVDDLPAAPPDVVPLLPAVIDPPQTAAALADDPIDAAVVAMRADDAVLLLATDGTWRSVPPPNTGSYGAELSADGTMLAVETKTGVDAWDLATGGRTSVSFPSADAKWLDEWQWIDDRTLLFDRPTSGGTTVDVASGEATRVPYPCCSGYWTVDEAGGVVETTSLGERSDVVDWANGTRRQVDPSGVEPLKLISADADTVVGDSGLSIAVLDRDSLEPRHILPLDDRPAKYAGLMGVVALPGNATVLIQVPAPGLGLPWHLVSWNPDSGALNLVSRGVDAVVASYAPGVLAQRL